MNRFLKLISLLLVLVIPERGQAQVESQPASSASTDMVSEHSVQGRDTLAAPVGVPSLRPLVVVSSGGISAGAYQAGVNWGVLNLLRLSDPRRVRADTSTLLLEPHELVVATGASAGGINSILGTIEWAQPVEMQKVGMPPPDSSLFWQVWTGIGVGELLAESNRGNERSLLSRSHMEEYVLENVFQSMGDRSLRLYRPVSTGLMLTSRTPFPVSSGEFSGGDKDRSDGRVEVESVRMASVVQATPVYKNGAISLGVAYEPYQFRSGQTDSFGSLVHLEMMPLATNMGGRGWALESGASLHSDYWGRSEYNARKVFRLAMASSAFPFAWDPVSLEVGLQVSKDRFSSRIQSVRERDFIDGGLFDNNPLGLARDLYNDRYGIDLNGGKTGDREGRYLESETLRGILGVGPGVLRLEYPRYFFTDPDNLRQWHSDEGEGQSAEGEVGLPREVLDLAVMFLNTGRQYELESEMRNMRRDELSNIYASDRYFPIIGTELFAFASFLGRPFREYDFYVGLYDSYVFAARHLGAAGSMGGRLEVGGRVRELYRRSGLDKADPVAALLMDRMICEEFEKVSSVDFCQRIDIDESNDIGERIYILNSILDVAIGARRNVMINDESWIDDVLEELRGDSLAMWILDKWGRQCLGDITDSSVVVGRDCLAGPHFAPLVDDHKRRLLGVLAQAIGRRERLDEGKQGRLTAVVLAGLNAHIANQRQPRRLRDLFNNTSIPGSRDGLGASLGNVDPLGHWGKALRFAPSRLVFSRGPLYATWSMSARLGAGRIVGEIAPFRIDHLYPKEGAKNGNAWPVWASSLHMGYDFDFPAPGIQLGGRVFAARQTNWSDEWGAISAGGEVALQLGYTISTGLIVTPFSLHSAGIGENERSLGRDDWWPHAYVSVSDIGGLMYWLGRVLS